MAEPVTVAEAGLKGARKRWAGHVPTRLYVGDLPVQQRRLILIAIEAERAKRERDALEERPEAA